MRLWSIHPKYLDQKGLVALWREALLAQAVLLGKTKGYRNHPQLQRFRNTSFPHRSINTYLWGIYNEAVARGYTFDPSKLAPQEPCECIPVTQGQLEFEWNHLLSKLAIRSPEQLQHLQHSQSILCHPLFQPIQGAVESWERNPGDHHNA
jgi:hypothetical protein